MEEKKKGELVSTGTTQYVGGVRPQPQSIEDRADPKQYLPIYRCIDCDMMYPVMDGKIMCNGREIDYCPYCSGFEGTIPSDILPIDEPFPGAFPAPMIEVINFPQAEGLWDRLKGWLGL